MSLKIYTGIDLDVREIEGFLQREKKLLEKLNKKENKIRDKKISAPEVARTLINGIYTFPIYISDKKFYIDIKEEFSNEEQIFLEITSFELDFFKEYRDFIYLLNDFSDYTEYDFDKRFNESNFNSSKKIIKEDNVLFNLENGFLVKSGIEKSKLIFNLENGFSKIELFNIKVPKEFNLEKSGFKDLISFIENQITNFIFFEIIK